MDIPHHIKYKKSITISRWKKVFGLKLREGETYEMIYDKVQNTKNCELCKVELCDGRKTNGRCMDHCHETLYYRMTLCRGCNSHHKRELQKNNTTGIRYIHKFKNGWRYQAIPRGSFTKYSTNKQIILWAMFVHQKIK
tara:strand:+ start:43 stop:456 length:414 start_codon:yes stop_codon:yes gene_type:complete